MTDYARTPIDISKMKQEEIEMEALRMGIIAEYDAINLYEQLARMVKREDLKKVFLDIAREEKTHVGEFQALLLRLDKEMVEELKKGKDEVEEKTGKSV